MSNPTDEQAYHEVCAWTLTRGDGSFIHQHVVDAWAAQQAHADSKAISVFFALAGLYLHVERGFTGRDVQRAHMKLAKHPEAWPVPELPESRGSVTARDVLAAPEGEGREAMIHEWARSVWNAFAAHQEVVTEVLQRHRILPRDKW
jgi:hypothetical protein